MQCALLVLLVFPSLLGCKTGAGAGGPGKLKVLTERHGIQTRFYLCNLDTTDMTATLELGLVNMQADVPIPRTVIVPAGETVEALTLTPMQGREDFWSFSYTNHYTPGRHDVAHDDSYLYLLPYTPGSIFRVSQGHHGTFSHTGPDEYAIDWKMPVGTPVLAARGGVVVAVRDDSEQGGARREFQDRANMILIRHADGTIGQYCHLAPHSAKVVTGQSISPGHLLAASGNTGFTSGPHLHFGVFKARDGYGRETIPVKFQTAEGTGLTLVSGESYRAIDPAALARQSDISGTFEPLRSVNP